MSSVVTVDQLLEGSATIDRMKAEVTSTVKLLVGLVDFERVSINLLFQGGRDVGGGEVRLGLVSENGFWNIIFCPGWHTSSSLEIEYWINSDLGQGKEGKTLCYKLGGQFPMSMVKVVRASLQFFVDSMLRVFPELRAKVRPLIEAVS